MERYKNKYLIFDNLQQQRCVNLSAIYGWLKTQRKNYSDITKQNFLVYCNNSGTNQRSTEYIFQSLIQHGLTPEEARARFYMVDDYGLITKARRYIMCSWIEKFAR